ncbi:hypothetical protein [Streptomyces sp. ODS28]|uniref:hypothetical protein n=1 Tax=Streptomyces sp. ODS28 TaxID=3136688 RepID=UPI0031F023BB
MSWNFSAVPVQAQGVAPKPPTTPPAVFHPGVMHEHQPSGRWRDVRQDPKSGFLIGLVCGQFDPQDVIAIAVSEELGDKPIARKHVDWYLRDGYGNDYNEDANLSALLTRDVNVQHEILKRIPPGRSSGVTSFHITITQSLYTDQDLRFAFGAIDRLDVEVDFSAGTVHAWFQDRYEWHPFYEFFSVFSGDVPRETNCLHAAFVEMKNLGFAKDFWMKGEATVPLSLIKESTQGRCSSWSVSSGAALRRPDSASASDE